VDGPALDPATAAEEVCADVEEILGDMEEVGDAKCTVMRAGPVIVSVLFMVITTAELWYFSRGRQLRQNFLRA